MIMICESNENISEILVNKEMYLYSDYKDYKVILYEDSIDIINLNPYVRTNIYNIDGKYNMLSKREKCSLLWCITFFEFIEEVESEEMKWS